ncbi:MAG: zf-HC2 domain-containing protein [Acidobacteria bacterium]|nr:zf-HC2 domain-containing protein [Acidobacteriota bacterium]
MMQQHVNAGIEEYLSGELDVHELRDFRRHLKECPSCARAVREAEDTQSCMQWLQPLEAPPAPGPDFYFKIQSSIQRNSGAGCLGSFALAFRGLRVAYPLIFLAAGLLISLWTFTTQTEWGEYGVLDIPPARFSTAITTEARRDLVMVSLVDED